MASRPVDRGFGRMAEPKNVFRPVKSLFGRMGSNSTPFYPAKYGFGRMGTPKLVLGTLEVLCKFTVDFESRILWQINLSYF